MNKDNLSVIRAKPCSGLLQMLYIARIENILAEKRPSPSRKTIPVMFNSTLLESREFKEI